MVVVSGTSQQDNRRRLVKALRTPRVPTCLVIRHPDTERSCSVSEQVRRLTTPPATHNQYISALRPTTTVDVRILDFQIVE